MIYMAADLHLIRFIWREKKELDGDSYRALHAMGDAIIADETEEEKYLILAGDVFEQNRIDGMTLEEFTKFLDNLSAHAVEVYFIQGQHDRNYPPHAEVQGAIWLQKYDKAVPIDGRLIYGLDWRSREELHEELKSVPACDLLVLHAQFEHMINYGAAADLTLADVPKHVKNILVGDIHIADLVEFNDGWCLSPGPLHPCNMAQGSPKYFWKLPKDAERPEPVELLSRKIMRLASADKVSLTSALEAALLELKGSDLDPIIEFSYKMEESEEAELLMQQNKGDIVFFPKACSGGRFLEHDNGDTPQDEVVMVEMPHMIDEVVTAAKDPELNRLMQDLWDGNIVEVVRNKIKLCLEDSADAVDEADFD